jgi:hypothetical protein
MCQIYCTKKKVDLFFSDALDFYAIISYMYLFH